MTVRYKGYYANDDERDYVVTLEKSLLTNGKKEGLKKKATMQFLQTN